MGKLISLTESQKRQGRLWNEGFGDGYHYLPSQTGKPEVYYTAYDVGKETRDEDEEALASGEVDHLSESEKEFLYGFEERRRDYASTD